MSRSASPPSRLRVAVIGTGGWAGHHARIFSGREDVALCGILGRDPERTRRRAERFGARAYTDLDTLLDREDPDLVSVCLPNQHHFEMTRNVIAAGKPLLVEKPLVFDLEEADCLLREARERGLFFAVNFNHRFSRPVRLAREAIAAGRLGDLVFATWRFGGEGDGRHHPLANLIETQCHGFDLLEYLCGPVAALSAEWSGAGSDATVALALRFASGAVGTFLGTYESSYAYRDAERLEINGRSGRVVISDVVRRYAFQASGAETAEVWEAGFFNDWDREFQRTFDNHVEALLTALRSGQEPPVPARAGRRALQLALLARESLENGRRIVVPAP